jgi:hypothetical protein
VIALLLAFLASLLAAFPTTPPPPAPRPAPAAIAAPAPPAVTESAPPTTPHPAPPAPPVDQVAAVVVESDGVQLPDETIGREVGGPDGQLCVVVDANGDVDCTPPL